MLDFYSHPGYIAGQSHLIFGIGSTDCATKSGLSKLCSVDALYKPREHVDAIALGYIAHKVHLLVAYDLEWDPLEMEDGEEVWVHTFTLEEALTSTQIDYRCDPEVALALCL